MVAVGASSQAGAPRAECDPARADSRSRPSKASGSRGSMLRLTRLSMLRPSNYGDRRRTASAACGCEPKPHSLLSTTLGLFNKRISAGLRALAALAHSANAKTLLRLGGGRRSVGATPIDVRLPPQAWVACRMLNRFRSPRQLILRDTLRPPVRRIGSK